MATVATGTDLGGAYRLTAARRLSALLLMTVAVFSQWLAAPAYVEASTPHQSEVRFPAAGEVGVSEVYDFEDVPNSLESCGGSGWSRSTEQAFTGTYSGKASSADPYACVPLADAQPTEGVTYRFYGYTRHGGGAGNKRLRFGFCPVATGSCTGSTLSDYITTASSSAWGNVEATLVAPAGAARFVVKFDGDQNQYLDLFRVFGTVDGGDCFGAQGAGGDAQLVWPSGALSSSTGSDQWGHQWLSSDEACMFADAESYSFVPAGGFTEGDTHSMAIQAWSLTAGRRCTINIAWNIPGPGGGGSITAVHFTTGSLEPVDAVGAYFAEDIDEPPGVTSIAINVSKYCVLAALLISNVEGDPILDTDGNPWTDGGEAPATGADYWGDCIMPADAFDVWGWLKWIGCILLGGFQYLADLLGEVVAALGAAFGDVILPGLDGIAGAIGGAIGGILEYLFVPTTLGDTWQDFTDDAATRVPFGWFSQVSAAVSGSLAAGSAGFEDMTLTIAGSSVNVGFASALAGVAPYRGLILAGAALIMTLGCLRWIMAAVGASPGGSAGDGD